MRASRTPFAVIVSAATRMAALPFFQLAVDGRAIAFVNEVNGRRTSSEVDHLSGDVPATQRDTRHMIADGERWGSDDLESARHYVVQMNSTVWLCGSTPSMLPGSRERAGRTKKANNRS